MVQEQKRGQSKIGEYTGVRQPHVALLHASMLLSGFGTVFLGPVLPALAANAHVSDTGSGLFFTAKFIGAFLGGLTTSDRLWLSLLRGSGMAAAGFLLLSLCAMWHAPFLWTAAAFLPLGFGVGQMLTSVNLLASQRFHAHQGAALSLVNFSWSLGAVLAPFLLGSLLPTVALQTILLFSASLFAVAFAATALNARFGRREPETARHEANNTARLTRGTFVYFASLLLIYGGVETSLSGWIATFGMRYGSGALRTGTLGTTALWLGLTAGRALAALLLRHVPERTLLIGSLAAASLLTAAVTQSHGGTAIVVLCALLGLSLAPWFPLVLSGMLGEGAAAGQVGTIIAVSGIGAATLPLMVGTVSRGTGSLRIALLVPLGGLLLLLGLAFRKQRRPAPDAAQERVPGV